jgi:putative transposase
MGKNSPYKTHDFLQVLLDAAGHQDFTNNTCVRVGGPTGETVFSRLKDADVDKITGAFHATMASVFRGLRRNLRNRKIALAFDTTDEPYYGKVAGLWIHPQRPVQGSTGCFKFITVSCTDKDAKFILGSLPVRIGADIVALVMDLAQHARRYIVPDMLLFDRGFDDYRLVEALQNARLRYQILWRKSSWTKKKFKEMKRAEMREINRSGKYSRNKSRYPLKLRFVLLKGYRRYAKGRAYDWVFCTNTRQPWQHCYVDKYKKRWGIETAFRVLDNIQIKTTTKNHVIRYFINIFCCLVYNLWKMVCVLEGKITLNNFVPMVLAQVLAILMPDPGG